MAHGGWTDTRTKVGGGGHLQLPLAPCRQVNGYSERGHPLLLPQVWVRWGETPSWGLYPHQGGRKGTSSWGCPPPGCVSGQMSDMGPAACRHLSRAADLSLESWGPGPPACPETTTAPAKTNRELKLTQEAPSWGWPWRWLCMDPQEHAHHPSSDPTAT